MQQLEDIIRYYREQGAPQDQQMLIALLRECQEMEGGALTAQTLAAVAQGCGVKESMLAALIRRVPSLRMADAPHRLDMCMTCPKGRELRAWVEKTWNVQSGQACTAAGFTYHAVPCMKNCPNGPSIRWDGVLYSRATQELIRSLIENKSPRP